jgi:hypothetical protein
MIFKSPVLLAVVLGVSLMFTKAVAQERAASDLAVIKGEVISSSDGKALLNARVTLTDTISGRVIAYAFTNTDGLFVLTVRNSLPPWRVEASSLGYKSESITVLALPQRELSFYLENSNIKLNEAVVVAPKVSLRGDTLNFLTHGFQKQGDITLEDVLKRLPGIEVSQSGEIRYNDTPINALYIDGKNILEGKYSLATRNFSPDVVSMIQIFENHQPVKALRDFTPSTSAAINLKLDPKAKAKWISTGDIYAGLPAPLADIRLLLFHFSPHMHSMNLVRANNRGKSISGELNSHSLGAAAQTQLLNRDDINLVNVTGVANPPIGEERALFNKSGYISANLLSVIKESSEASIRLGYIYEQKEREVQEWTEYLVGDQDKRVIGESSSFFGMQNTPELDFVYKTNSNSYFLQNRLNLKMRFENNSSSLLNPDMLSSRAELRQFEGSEIVTWIKPYNRSLLKITSNTSISSSPQNLFVEDSSNINRSVRQEASLFQVLSNNSASFIKRAKLLTLESGAGVNLKYQRLNSRLSYNQEHPSQRSLLINEIYIFTGARYEREKIRVTLNLPLKMVNGSLSAPGDITGRYRFNPYWEISAGIRVTDSYSDIRAVDSALTMVNYRLFVSGTDTLFRDKSINYFVRGTYNNPLKLVNITSSIAYIDDYNNSVSYLSYMGDYILLNNRFEKGDGNSLSATFSFTKSFFDSPLLVDFRVSAVRSSFIMVQQDIRSEIIQKNLSFTPKIEFSPLRSLDIELIAPFSLYESRSLSGSGNSQINISPSFNNTLSLSGGVTISLNLSLFINELSKGLFYASPFADIKIRYKTGRGEYFGEVVNIFNKREYRYRTIGNLSLTERYFKLRPVSFVVGYRFTL